MFRGSHEHAIDAKGRTSLPSRFRDALATTGESRIVLTPDVVHTYLRVYPLAEWNRQEAALSEDGEFDDVSSTARRFAIGDCADCDVDKLGRVLIPAPLRERAKLERDVIWVGVGKSIELWDMKHYLAMRAEVLGNTERLHAVAKHLSAVRAK